ncbi:MAG TPA: hypothetical protein VGM19_12020 [Armatimonadota bacterium]
MRITWQQLAGSRRVGLAGGLLLVTLAAVAPAGASPFRTLSNTPFASRCNGPQGAIVVAAPAPGQVSAQAVGAAVASQHSLATLRRAQYSLQALQRARVKSPAAEVRFPRLMYEVSAGRLVLPELASVQAAGTGLGSPTNTLTFTYEGFADADKATLQAYLTNAYPKMVQVYGPPAFNMTVNIVQDATIHPLQGGIYNPSTNEIRIPPLSGNYPEDTFVLCMLVLHAFRDDVALYYDAWEEGMAGAAATVIQSIPGVAAGYNPVDPGPFYAWSVYECQNQPALGNNTFYPASGFSGMLVWRISMARSVWLKCWAEDNNFFRNFNQAYYASYVAGLPGDVPGLKDIAAQVLPSVEKMSFYDWFQRQYVLDTSVHTGLKLYTWNAPLEDSVLLLIEHYLTGLEGAEAPRGGTANLIYWNYDNTLSLYSEEGNVVSVPASGAGAGEGQIIPAFVAVGGPERITVQVDLNGLRGQYPYAYGVRGFNPGENNFYGCIMDGPTATLDVSGAYTKAGLSAARGVWGTILGSGRLSPGQVTTIVTNPQGQKVTRAYNVGWDSYAAFPSGGGQAALTHTFTRPANGVLMISLPIDPLQSNAATLFGLDPAAVLLAHWDPTAPPDGAYQIYPRMDPMAPGRAYWVKLATDVQVNVAGVLPAENQDFSVPVGLGWNMIGSPRRSSVAVSSLKVQVGTATAIPFADALTRGYLQTGLYRYVPGTGYQRADTVDPYEGYWLRCLVPGGVRLVFPAL